MKTYTLKKSFLKNIRMFFILSAVLLAGCKPAIPPTPIPLTKAITGVKAPCENLVFGGFPRKEPIVNGTFFICRKESYVLNLDPRRKTPEWVAEDLAATNLNSPDKFEKINDSRPDPLLPRSAQAKLNDYIGTGYKELLLASPNDFKYNDVAYSHSYYLSNAVPQYPGQSVTWRALNTAVRELAKTRGELYIISGPVYVSGVGLGWIGVPDDINASGNRANIGKIEVPTDLFKILIDPKRHQSIAFLIPNTATYGAPLSSFVVSIAQIEQLTQMRIAPDLSLKDQAALKTQRDVSKWTIR